VPLLLLLLLLLARAVACSRVGEAHPALLLLWLLRVWLLVAELLRRLLLLFGICRPAHKQGNAQQHTLIIPVTRLGAT
jgi:hypothetical protein